MPTVPPANWQLHVRNADGDRVCAVTEFTKATFIQRFNAVGGWAIEGLPMVTRAAIALVPGAGIEAVREGDTILSGPMVQPTLTWDDAGYRLVASGVDDNLLLAGRLCYPAAPSVNLNAAYSDDRSGVAETVLRAYVDANLGPSAAAVGRGQDVGLAVDGGHGGPVTYSARLDRLLDVLAQLALPEVAGGAGLGFRIVAVDPDVYGYSRQFQVYVPTDRTTTARFSPQLGNLVSRTFDTTMARLNHVVVGGGGDGTLRVFSQADNVTSQATWGLRLEGFKDQRQTDDVAELAQAAQEELVTGGDQVSLTIEPVSTGALAYGSGWLLGDVVRVQLSDSGTVLDEVVREVRFTLDADGETIVPLVGTPGAVPAGSTAEAAVDVLLAQQAALARRLGRLERAQ